jgi:hypothetical protein
MKSWDSSHTPLARSRGRTSPASDRPFKTARTSAGRSSVFLARSCSERGCFMPCSVTICSSIRGASSRMPGCSRVCLIRNRKRSYSVATLYFVLERPAKRPTSRPTKIADSANHLFFAGVAPHPLQWSSSPASSLGCPFPLGYAKARGFIAQPIARNRVCTGRTRGNRARTAAFGSL